MADRRVRKFIFIISIEMKLGLFAFSEIDTFEGVNQVTNSQMGLHTLPGCTQVGQKQSSQIVNSTDCSFQSNSNEGCITTVPTTSSYGEAFAQAGGGVFVTEFAESGIS